MTQGLDKKVLLSEISEQSLSNLGWVSLKWEEITFPNIFINRFMANVHQICVWENMLYRPINNLMLVFCFFKLLMGRSFQIIESFHAFYLAYF